MPIIVTLFIQQAHIYSGTTASRSMERPAFWKVPRDLEQYQVSEVSGSGSGSGGSDNGGGGSGTTDTCIPIIPCNSLPLSLLAPSPAVTRQWLLNLNYLKRDMCRKSLVLLFN